MDSDFSVLPDPPQGTVFLERKRLHSLLEVSIESIILVISAGKGYGKTLAVSSFLKNRPEARLWFTASDGDSRLNEFWECYARTMGQGNPEAGRLLLETGFPETKEQFDLWFEAAGRKFVPGKKCIIVLDDFDLIASRPMLDFIDKTLSRPVSGHLLVLICRRDPPLNIVSSISKGRLTRVGAEELLFTRDETAAYFSLLGVELSPEEAASVHSDTEGVSRLLAMAAGTIRERGGYFPDSARSRIYIPFFDELFFSILPDVRNYLVKLSLFEKWSFDLIERTSVLLPRLGKEKLWNEFEKIDTVIRYDYYLPGLRIHRLFLDYLRDKREAVGPDEIREISLIAAKWCLDNNLKTGAALHFERAADYAGIAAIADSYPNMIPRALAAPLLDIVRRITAKGGGAAGDGTINGSGAVNGGDESFAWLCGVVQGRLLLSLSRGEEAAALFRDTIARYAGMPPSPQNSRILAESWNYLGNIAFLARKCDGTDTYIECFQKAEYYYRMNPYPPGESVTTNYIGANINQVPFPSAGGELDRRLDILVESLSPAANSLNGRLRGVEELGRAELAYFRGNLDAVEQYGRTAAIRAIGEGRNEIAIRGFFLLMRTALHRGGAGELMELWKQKDSLLENAKYPARGAMSEIMDGWLNVQLGRPEKASPWLRNSREKSGSYSMFHNYECLVKAKYFFANKMYGEAIAVLDMPENRQSMGISLLGFVEMKCLKAAALCRAGGIGEALAAFSIAYNAAAPDGIAVPFVELGGEMRALSAAVLAGENDIPHPWLEEIRKLASAYEKNIAGIVCQLGAGPGNACPVYFCRRERSILRGLSLGLSREQIAVETGRPLGTVKNQIAGIYAKLGAVNRADAIRLASGLGLLDSPNF